MVEPALLLDVVIRILTAAVLGAAIGLERQWRLRTAGIRTNALVSTGAALFVIVGAISLDGANADPTRVASQIVSGIGFLGAGVILRDGIKIRGLTTAATLWCAAAVGSLAGAGMEELALLGGAAIVATNTLLRPLSRWVNRRMQDETPLDPVEDEALPVDYVLEVVTSDKSEQRIRALVLQAVDRPEYTLHSLNVRPGKNSEMKLLAGVSAAAAGDTTGLQVAVQRISLDPKVTSSRWWSVDSED
ncbi:MgtC/SapB family protein [Rathayibacter festucae]|uniref:MgtC/SapB family protein n=1 Tax=Rathayibacter festucae TaxID=110937 RepID=UPI001FB2FD60|nr:MgtC/SapB family protein [Rathayibacter festucae]MCJ1702101.1 MgtC/SapB family protein [Rathayibacter festucae]